MTSDPEKTAEDMETDTTAVKDGDSEEVQEPKQTCLMIYMEPVTWEDVVSPQVQAFAKKALRYHLALHPSKETGMKVGGARFVFTEQKDLDEVKKYMEPLTKKNAETHKMREKMATGMVYPTDTIESNQALKSDNRNVFIKNLPEHVDENLLKFVFPKATDISIIHPEEDGKAGQTERTGLIKCKSAPEARAYVERGDGIAINDTEIRVVRNRKTMGKRRTGDKQAGRRSTGGSPRSGSTSK